VLIVACAFSFGAIVQIARADHYHVNCVGHGFVHGGNTTDGLFYAQAEAGCGSTSRSCYLYTNGSLDGGVTVAGTTTTCTAQSTSYGAYSECHSTAHVESAGVFANHVHKAHNWCG
jgi:hypothetical protein